MSDRVGQESTWAGVEGAEGSAGGGNGQEAELRPHLRAWPPKRHLMVSVCGTLLFSCKPFYPLQLRAARWKGYSPLSLGSASRCKGLSP